MDEAETKQTETHVTKKVYVGSSLHNSERVKDIQNKLRIMGYEVTYDWTTHNFVEDPDKLKEIGEAELRGVLDADLFFMVQEGRKGTHVELGAAITKRVLASSRNGLSRIEIVILCDEGEHEPKSFYYLDFVNNFDNEEAALAFAETLIK